MPSTSAAPTTSPAATPPPSPSPTPTATAEPPATPNPTATPAAGPASPDFLKLTYGDHTYPDGSTTITTTAHWTPYTTTGVTINVYGVNKCLNTVPSGDCVTHGMHIPTNSLLLLASAPAEQGKAGWQYWIPEGASYYCGALGVVASRNVIATPDKWYYAVLLRAVDANGASKYVIAATSTNDIYTC